MKVLVIIPAAGLGTRMTAASRAARGSQPSKQFAQVGGAPILIHTIRKFATASRIRGMYIALRNKQERDLFHAHIAGEHLQVQVKTVQGGESRQQSVANAIAALDAEPHDVVLVHDAVRPFVDHEIIGNVIEAAAKQGAAIAALPAADTVKQVERTAEGAIITATIPRERVVLAQTPQGFHYELLKKAFDEAQREDYIGTDEASLVERLGHNVAVVMGSARNIKITTPADLELAEFFLTQG